MQDGTARWRVVKVNHPISNLKPAIQPRNFVTPRKAWWSAVRCAFFTSEAPASIPSSSLRSTAGRLIHGGHSVGPHHPPAAPVTWRWCQ